MVENAAVRVARTIPAPPEDVFRAWTEPERLAGWFGPGAFTVVTAELDLRPGGAYRIVFAGHPSGPVTLVGAYREIDPPRRLAFTWSWRHSWPDQPESLVTVELADAPGGATEVVVTHSRFGTDEAAYRGGWESGLDKLARRFAGAAVGGGDEACPWPSTR
jgi:uncharacterized protein YndB with AHSA1/START domain